MGNFCWKSQLCETDAPKGQNNIARGNAPGTRNARFPPRPERAIQHRTSHPASAVMRTTPWSFVLPLQGEIFRVAFLLFLGRCPQAMLFQSFGLERPTMRDRSGVAHRLCCFSPSDWKGPNHARQVGRCPRLCCFSPSDWKGQPCATDRALPQAMLLCPFGSLASVALSSTQVIEIVSQVFSAESGHATIAASARRGK